MGQNNNPGVRGGFAKVGATGSALAALLLAPSPAWAASDAATQQFLVLGAVTTGAVAGVKAGYIRDPNGYSIELRQWFR